MALRLLVVLAGLLCLSRPATAAPPVYPCFHCSVPPVIDADIAGDPAWANIPAATGFSVLGKDFTIAKQTVAQACWDEQALYVAVTCEEPDAAHLKPKMTDGGAFWDEDSIEIFVQPGPSARVYQLAVTAGGAKAGYEGFPDITKFQARAAIGTDSYTIEARIPHDMIGARPRIGDQWRANICRNITTTLSGGDKFTCWAPLKARFLEPENFAIFDLRGQAPDAATAARLTDQLSLRYRNHLIRGLQATSRLAREYLPVLTEASGDAQYGARARELRDGWLGIRQLLRAARQAPILNLRKTNAGAEALAKASYDLKYGYLISKLFPD